MADGRRRPGLDHRAEDDRRSARHPCRKPWVVRWWTAERRALAKRVPLERNGVLDLDIPQSRETSPTQAAQHNEREALIRLGLELLEPDERELIVLHIYQGLSHGEIAKRLSVSEPACRQRHKRAVGALDAIVKKLRQGQIEQLVSDDDEP